MYDELENRDLIIIDTNKPMLDDAASAFFGRLFIAMILRASHQRFAEGGTPRPVYVIVDEAHEYFDKSISDMLEQARKANIGLIVSHQSISQSRGGKGGNIADPLMVNTATKLIWTSFRDDAAKFAGSMQVKPEDILNLPQFTFGMYSRKRGFLPVRGEKNALIEFPRRGPDDDLKEFMELKYGPLTEPQPKDETPESDDTKNASEADNGEEETDTKGKPNDDPDDDLGDPPDVETI